ncbi:MAG TPA: hypothetical protein PK619_02690 [bacterium]|nr:hypothetical protein [bacterium]HPN81343.1 hypothetical protein [bacterium]HPW39603.1 hypothetical protein [bacterium]
MGLWNQNPLNQFRPKTIKFSDVYKHRTNYAGLSASNQKKITASLKQAGYSDKQINQLVRQNAALPTKQVEKAISALKNSGVSGFDYDAKKIVNSYVRHEMIKKRNINRVMRERRQEAWSEDLLGGKNSATGSASQSSTRQKPKLKF